ncbi:hypothetical protein SLEP1_g54669 [Rubroshorea leprosula]|uniref:Uncharacterized protein n=1 Tax=Rubroshorea leprosula TaxID=152421 RepID=A0AAV5MEA4_9ROSI|nr:hypothetical protein SLEP1_g54669 [Rubroshorea leprosula]
MWPELSDPFDEMVIQLVPVICLCMLGFGCGRKAWLQFQAVYPFFNI